jgi:hypothetical protein
MMYNSTKIVLKYPRYLQICWLTLCLTVVTSTRFTHGQSSRFLIVDKVNVGQVQNVVVSWNYQSILLDPTSFCGLTCNTNLYVNNVEVASLTSYPQS